MNAVVRRLYRTERYAFGILRNRFAIRPAQREPIMLWLTWLHKHECYDIGTVCDLCADCDTAAEFYGRAKRMFRKGHPLSLCERVP